MATDYLELIQGVAFYDCRGLPQRLFTVADRGIHWTEQAFQALELQKFVCQALDLPSFDYGCLMSHEYTIVLTKTEDNYIACLKNNDRVEEQDLVEWLQTISMQTIENDRRFLNL